MCGGRATYPFLSKFRKMFHNVPPGMEKFGYSYIIIPPYTMENSKNTQLKINFQFLNDWSIFLTTPVLRRKLEFVTQNTPHTKHTPHNPTQNLTYSLILLLYNITIIPSFVHYSLIFITFSLYS